MAWHFFCSYARSNNDPYLQQFVTDLSEAVREKLGEAKNARVAFFDQQAIELGGDWDRTIVDALCSTKSLVALVSPAFFKSTYSAKELGLFDSRCGAKSNNISPLIKPIIWLPFKAAEVPAPFSQRQFTCGDPDAVHNVKGVKFLLRQIQKYRSEYTDLIDWLADDINDTVDKYPLAPMPTASRLADTIPFWTAAAGTAAIRRASTFSPKHVRFVYLAPDPTLLDGPRSKEIYVEAGGGDWKPFYPERSCIHRTLQEFVASEEVGFTSDELPFGPNLIQQIEAAWALRQIVVVVVDAWSLCWDSRCAAVGYQRVLQQLDRRNDFHWSVLVPWNDHDPDLQADRASIESTLNDTFPFHGRLAKNPMFYREGIKSVQELRTTLAEVLARLRAEINKQAPVQMPIPPGPSKFIVSGPAIPPR